MPKKLSSEEVNLGEIKFGWEVKEYENHDHDRRWYIMMGVVAITFFVYALATANYLFALILALFGIILFLQDLHPARTLNFVITTTGVVLGEKFYSFTELKGFWMIYNPPAVKNLYFSTGDLVKHRLSIPLFDNDPRPIRNFLNEFLEENLEEEEEPLSERMSRLFKI